MTWFYLILAVAFEVGGAICMKQSAGFTRPGPSLLMFGLFGASIASLTYAAGRIGIGVSYAVWGGLATSLIAGVGYYVYDEPLPPVKWLAIGLIAGGVVLLNLSDFLTR